MALTPPPAGRDARLPQLTGIFSNPNEIVSRLKEAFIPRMLWLFGSVSEAETTMASDGLPWSPVFAVRGDRAVYVNTTSTAGQSVRIGENDLISIRLGKLRWSGSTSGGDEWSDILDVKFLDDLDGQIPDIVLPIELMQYGSFYKWKVAQLTDGTGEKPDWNATRTKVAAWIDPVPSNELFRYIIVLAIKRRSV